MGKSAVTDVLAVIFFVIAIVAIFAAVYSVGAWILMFLVGLATAGAVTFTFLQSIGILALASFVGAFLFSR